jgi:hypothetical protein
MAVPPEPLRGVAAAALAAAAIPLRAATLADAAAVADVYLRSRKELVTFPKVTPRRPARRQELQWEAFRR